MCHNYFLFGFKFDINGNFSSQNISNIPTPTEIIPIPIPKPMEICFSFPYPWESHGIPIMGFPFQRGIPFPCRSLPSCRALQPCTTLRTGSGSSIGGSRLVADDADDVVERGRDSAEQTALGVPHRAEQLRRAFRHSRLERLRCLVHWLAHHLRVHPAQLCVAQPALPTPNWIHRKQQTEWRYYSSSSSSSGLDCRTKDLVRLLFASWQVSAVLWSPIHQQQQQQSVTAHTHSEANVIIVCWHRARSLSLSLSSAAVDAVRYSDHGLGSTTTISIRRCRANESIAHRPKIEPQRRSAEARSGEEFVPVSKTSPRRRSQELS